MGTLPLKIKISKIRLRHVLSWPKLGLEPKCHDPGTFGGFGKRGQTNKHTRFMFYKYRYKYTYKYTGPLTNNITQGLHDQAKSLF